MSINFLVHSAPLDPYPSLSSTLLQPFSSRVAGNFQAPQYSIPENFYCPCGLGDCSGGVASRRNEALGKLCGTGFTAPQRRSDQSALREQVAQEYGDTKTEYAGMRV